MSEQEPLLSQSTQGWGKDNISTRRFSFLLGSLYFGTFLAAMDGTIVSTLLPTISSDLKVLDNISWVATSYLVAYSAFQPLYGKLSDIYGRRNLLILSTLICAGGCYLCSIATGISSLVCGRILNGIGAGGMLSLASITVSDYVPQRMRGLFQGVTNICFASGASCGGIIGSVANRYSTWRAAFRCQIPLLFLSCIVLFLVVKNKTDGAGAGLRRIDFMGSISLATTVCAFMLGVTTGGNQFAWVSWPVFGLFGLFLAMGFLFWYWETKKAPEPVLPIPLLTQRTVLSACLTNFFGSGVLYMFMFYAPIFLTARFNVTPGGISARLVPLFFGAASGSLGSGYWMHKTGKYYKIGVMATTLMLCSCILFLCIPLVPEAISSSAVYHGILFLLLGFTYTGMLTITLVTLIAAAGKQQATATSAQYTFRGAGSSVGVALGASAFQNVLTSELHKRVIGHGAHKAIKKVSKSVGAIRKLPIRFQEPVITAFTHATMACFAVGIVWAAITVLTSASCEEFSLDHQRELEEVANEVVPEV